MRGLSRRPGQGECKTSTASGQEWEEISEVEGIGKRVAGTCETIKGKRWESEESVRVKEKVALKQLRISQPGKGIGQMSMTRKEGENCLARMDKSGKVLGGKNGVHHSCDRNW